MNRYNHKNKENKTILLFGSSGRLGKAIYKYLNNNKTNIQLFTTSRNDQKSNFYFEVGDIQKLKKIIKETNPDTIINCIGYTDVDKCELKKDIAYKINSIFPEDIIKTIKTLDISPKVVHISTDQIYKSNNWSEIGQEMPLNIYSKSKLLGDQNIFKYKKSIILRTNFLWNNDKDGPVSWLKNKCSNNEEFILFNDIFYNPVEINFLSSLIYKIIFRENYGIYNIGSSTFLSKADVFYKIAMYLNLDLSKAKFDSINSTNLNAERPKNMTISVNKFEKVFNIKMPSMEKTLSLLLKE
tara:strand:+ start:130 stop:1020 length:891 start_codon:yes stop_codon:yes gene_type:complete